MYIVYETWESLANKLFTSEVKELILNSKPKTENNAGSLIRMSVKEFSKQKTDWNWKWNMEGGNWSIITP